MARRRRRSSKIFGMSPMTLALVGVGAVVGYKLMQHPTAVPATSVPAADNVATAVAKAAGSFASLFSHT